MAINWHESEHRYSDMARGYRGHYRQRSHTGMDLSVSRQRTCTQTWPGNMVGESQAPTAALKVNELIKGQQLKFM